VKYGHEDRQLDGKIHTVGHAGRWTRRPNDMYADGQTDGWTYRQVVIDPYEHAEIWIYVHMDKIDT